jgi:HEAT repeat protein
MRRNFLVLCLPVLFLFSLWGEYRNSTSNFGALAQPKCQLLKLFGYISNMNFGFTPIETAPIQLDRSDWTGKNQVLNVSQYKNQILYLLQAEQVKRGINLYNQMVKESGSHDFSILEQMGYILLKKGAESEEEEQQLLSMYGAGIASLCESMDIYEMGIMSSNPLTQMATIQFLHHIQDDRAEEILFKAFNSPFLLSRMEAAYVLASKKSERATGMIDALMQKLPPFFRIYFPELFAMIGSTDAIAILQRLVGDAQVHVRLASILAVAKFGRDDFLQTIRAGITHSDPAEQETCAAALGYLKDSHSIPKLQKLTTSNQSSVKLAACHSLTLLGDNIYWEPIIQSAAQKNPLALHLLASIPHTESLLAKLANDYDFSISVNAALALLKKRDARAIPTLMKVLIKEDRGFIPKYSLGHSLMAWKVIHSCEQYAKKMKQDIPSITLALREKVLQEMVELPEEDFLAVAKELFDKREHDLIPLLIHLLENLSSPKAISLLQEQSKRAGAPFIRTYCHLALYRLKVEGPHQEILFKWIQEQKDKKLIRFRPILPWTAREGSDSPYLLTPEETSRLLIEALGTLAQHHDPKGIDILLEAISEGHAKNRCVIAGLLLKAIQ